ncbi:MAG: hypothetical protein ACT4O6_20735 [Reyranella sp.]
MSLHFAHYNFVRQHKSLRMTPAMAGGVEKSLWSLQELVERTRNKGGAKMDFNWLRLAAVIVAGLVMCGGLWGVFNRMKAKDQGFGPNSLRALGMVIFVPGLIVIGVTFPDFKSETIAALLGTVAGYILSQATDKESN